MAGTACRSGQMTCVRLSSCGSRFAGSAPDSIRQEIPATVPVLRWWTTSSPIAGTGGCLLTLPTTRACVSTTMTRKRPWNKQKSAEKTQETDLANALEPTSARRYACPRPGMRVPRRAGQAEGLLPCPPSQKSFGQNRVRPRAPSGAGKFPRSGFRGNAALMQRTTKLRCGYAACRIRTQKGGRQCPRW